MTPQPTGTTHQNIGPCYNLDFDPTTLKTSSVQLLHQAKFEAIYS